MWLIQDGGWSDVIPLNWYNQQMSFYHVNLIRYALTERKP